MQITSKPKAETFSVVQDMPSLYFALLNIASAVEECDARMLHAFSLAGYKIKIT